MRIYVDTSIINGLYTQDPRMKTDTEQFFKSVRLLHYHLYASEATIEEIEDTPNEAKKRLLKKVIEDYQIEILSMVDEIRWLANKYVEAKIIPRRYFPDALHIAVAAT